MKLDTILHFSILLLASFTSSYIIIPKIIGVVTFKKLMDNPNHRSSHITQTPSLGGISFFITLVLGLYFIQSFDEYSLAMTIIPGLLILFIIGLKDDLVVLSPLTKIGAQLAAVGFILVHQQFQIHEFNGFWGIEELTAWVTIPLSAFIMIAIINAYNLIDGIDGLASTVGIIIFTILGVLFYWIELYFFCGICIIMIGALLAFLRFNISAKKKIFMGDTGSLIIGFVIALCVIRMFAVPKDTLILLPFQLENLPVIIMAILVVPFFDTARVFTIRIMNKKGPFSPDRNHIHHLLIDYLKLSHRRASFFVGVFNFLFIVVFILLGAVMGNWRLTILFITISLLLVYFFYRINFSYKNLRRRSRIKNLLKRKK